jgi:hypothetical protein
MITKFELGFKIHTNVESPFEMKVDRQNPSEKQIADIRKWINDSIDEYLEDMASK